MADPLREAIRRYVTARRRDEGWCRPGNAPGHGHDHPPIWDGTQRVCALCCAWAVLVAIADEPEPCGSFEGRDPIDLPDCNAVERLRGQTCRRIWRHLMFGQCGHLAGYRGTFALCAIADEEPQGTSAPAFDDSPSD